MTNRSSCSPFMVKLVSIMCAVSRWHQQNTHGYRALKTTQNHHRLLACLHASLWAVKPKFDLARHVTARHDTTRSTCRACRDERFDKLDIAIMHGLSCGSKNFEEGGSEDNLSAPSSFIANTDNEIYAFYTEKSGFLKKNEPIGGGHPTAPSPLNPPLHGIDASNASCHVET